MARRRVDLPSVGLLWLRVLAGLSIASHGAAKIFGGGMAGFTEGVAGMGVPLPGFFAWAAALSEGLGGLCVAAGLGTRVAAAMVWCTMSVALFLAHAHDPFQKKELAFVYWAVAGALALTGAGAYAAEAWLAGWRRSRKP